MKKTIQLLSIPFESSSGLTEEFKHFYNTFKKEFTIELRTIGATEIKFSRGHFYISGFFTIDGQAFYFSLSDVRGFIYNNLKDPYSCIHKLLYRTAQNYKDYTGGANQWISIESGMCSKININ